MNGRMRQRKGYWLAGTTVALAGVALARLVAPELAGTLGHAALGVGYLLVAAGLATLAAATRRRDAEEFKYENTNTSSEGSR